jgi:hypothetical protein
MQGPSTRTRSAGSIMVSIPQRTYLELIHDLERFDAYLTGVKLQRSPDRLRLMIAKLKEIELARTRNELPLLNRRPDIVELIWSAIEGLEFAEIFRGICGYDAATVKRLMHKALKGPLHPGCETSSASNLGRNTVFELRLGAGLRQAGANVILGEQADLLIDHAGTHVFVECKRPFQEHNIGKNIREARAQLRRRLATDSHSPTAGLVAISISKAVNPGQNMFIVDDVDQDNDVFDGLASDVRRIHQQYGGDYDRLVDLRLIGILYHIFTPAFVRKSGLLTAASRVEIFFHTPALQVVFPLSEGAPLKSLLIQALRQ